VSKYIPKAGQEFQWRSKSTNTWSKKEVCIVHSAQSVGYESSNGWIKNIDKKCEFRPIPTKADVEREQLLDIMNKIFYGKDAHKIHAVQEIQNLNFTIPKKIKRSDVYNTVESFVFPISGTRLTDAICEVLGDLVEQDEGGAE
jgi:hypothetical protein